MWMMYVGITGIESKVFVSFVYSNSSKNPGRYVLQHDIRNDKTKCLHLFQCFMEAKCTTLPKTVTSIFSGDNINLSNITLLPHNISSLIFFMSASKQQWRILDLEKCNVGNIGMNSLFEHVIKNEDNMSTLEYVDLSENGSSPWDVYCAIIRHCSVGSLTLCEDNGMEDCANEIKASLNANSRLSSLTLCKVSELGLQLISKILACNNTLKEVNLSWKKIGYKEIKDKSNILVDSLCSMSMLDPSTAIKQNDRSVNVCILDDGYFGPLTTIVDLSKSKIDDDGIIVLIGFGLYVYGYSKQVIVGSFLKKNITLKELHLSDNFITSIGMECLQKSVKNMVSLEYVDLSDNCCSPWGVYCAIIRYSCVDSLTLCGDNEMNEHVEEIRKSLEVSKNLNSLTICKVGKTAVESLKQILHHSSNLNTVKLCWRKLSSKQIKDEEMVLLNTEISSAARKVNIYICDDHCQGLSPSSIRLRCTDITDNTALLIAFGMWDNTLVHTLCVSECKLSSNGIIAISSFLKSNNKMLQKLDMSSNHIDITGAHIIAEIIRCNTVLQSLNISYCGIPDDGALEISGSYKCSTALKELIITWNQDKAYVNTASSCCDLSGQEINNNGARILSNLLCNKHQIQSLHISRCGVDRGVQFILSNCGNVTELDLSCNDISSEAIRIAEVITINILRCLNISSCNISEQAIIAISNSLKYNSSLQRLNISHNKVTSKAAIAVSDSLRYNSSLQRLDVSHNALNSEAIISISDSLKYNCSLQRLNLSHNKVNSKGAEYIAKAIQNNSVLVKLDISKCDIPDDGAVVISESYRHSTSLETLKMTWNNAVNTVNQFEDETLQLLPILVENDQVFVSTANKICDLIREHIGNTGVRIISNLLCSKNTVITELYISYNNISYDGIEAICDSLSYNNVLQYLVMSYNEINSDGARKIANAIQLNVTLKKLDISYCGIPDVEALAISEVYKFKLTLEELIISWKNNQVTVNTSDLHCRLSNKGIGDIGAQIMSNLLYNKYKIKTIKVSTNNIGYNGLKAITERFKFLHDKIGHLETLDISHNDMSTERVMIFAEGIKCATTLRKLDISNCRIMDDGIVAIISCLKYNNCLQELKMSHSSVSSSGAKNIAQFIQINTTLQMLDISNCGIPLDGAVNISESYKRNKTLKKIIISWERDRFVIDTASSGCDLHGQNIGNVGVQIISNLLHNKCKIQKLNVSQDNITASGLIKLADCLVSNNFHALQEINLSNNVITSESYQQICYVIDFNKTLLKLDISSCGIPENGAVIISESYKRSKTLQEFIISWENDQFIIRL